MGTFAKVTIFSFSLIGIFALLFSSIPGAFFYASYNPILGTDKEIAQKFSLANITMYSNLGEADMIYTYSSYHDESPPEWDAGLPSGQYIEVAWNLIRVSSYLTIKAFEIVHIEEVWWGLHRHDRAYYTGVDTGIKYSFWLTDAELEDEYDTNTNGSAFYAECGHVVFSIIYQYNTSKYTSISNAWDNNELGYSLSYELDWNATGISAWTIIGQLLTFQNPDLGIPGDGGSILNYLIAIPLWVGIAIALIYITLALIPFISGLND